jgi:hypothetical protein
MKRKPATQTYAVGVGKYGEAIYEATSPQSARSQAWRTWKSLKPELSFSAFVELSSVRKLKSAKSTMSPEMDDAVSNFARSVFAVARGLTKPEGIDAVVAKFGVRRDDAWALIVLGKHLVIKNDPAIRACKLKRKATST